MTIKDLALKEGVTEATVRSWIKSGKIQGVVKRIKERVIKVSYYDIPDDSTVEKANRGRPRLGSLAGPQTIEEARERFNSQPRPLTYDEVEKLFENNISMTDISLQLGVSRERIRQMYHTYFTPFHPEWAPTGRDRLMARTQVKHAEKLLESIDNLDKVSRLRIFCEEFKLNFEPIFHQTSHRTLRAAHNRALVNGHKVLVSFTAGRFDPNHHPGGITYWRVGLSSQILLQTDFTTILVDEEAMAEIAFVIPNSELLKCKNPKRNEIYFYIPTENRAVYNNRERRISWWDWEGRWDLLETPSEPL